MSVPDLRSYKAPRRLSGDPDIDLAIQARRPIHKRHNGGPFCGAKVVWLTVDSPRWKWVTCKRCLSKAP